jgi:hypothetical protein
MATGSTSQRVLLLRNRKFADSPLEEGGFELMVPPRTERKWEGAGTHQHYLARERTILGAPSPLQA